MIRRLSLLFALLGCVIAGLADEPEGAITPETLSFDFNPEWPQPQLRVPFKTGKNAKPLQEIRFDLTTKGRVHYELSNAFTSKWTQVSESRSFLEIFALTNMVLPAGVHELRFQAAPNAEPIKLTLTRPAPRLAAPTKIVVRRTHGDQTIVPVRVREGSGEASAALQIQPSTILQIGTTNTLEAFSMAPTKVTRGSWEKLSLQVAPLPPGLNTGSLKLVSNESTDPLVTIDYEIRTILHLNWLALALVGGVLISFVLRVILENAIQKQTARREAFTLIAEIAAAETLHRDSKYRDEYAQALQDLNIALQGGKIDVIQAKIQALNKAWEAAGKDLDLRRPKGVAEVEKLRPYIQCISRALLPKSAGAFVQQAVDAFDAARASLAEDDIVAVNAQCADAVSKLQETLRKIDGWVKELQSLLVVLEPGANTFPGNLATTLIADLKSRVDKLATDPSLSTLALPDISAFRPTLDLTNTVMLNAGERLKLLASRLQQPIEVAKLDIEKLKSPKLPIEKLAAPSQLTKDLAAALFQSLDAPNAALVREIKDGLEKAWTRLFQEAFGNLPAPIISAIKAGEYASVVRMGAGGSEAESLPALSLPLTLMELVPATEHNLQRISLSGLGAIPTRERVLLRLAQTREKLTLLDWGKKILLGLLAVGIGYLTLSEKWIGGTDDMAFAFFWGFGFDFTLDAILKKAKTS